MSIRTDLKPSATGRQARRGRHHPTSEEIAGAMAVYTRPDDTDAKFAQLLDAAQARSVARGRFYLAEFFRNQAAKLRRRSGAETAA